MRFLKLVLMLSGAASVPAVADGWQIYLDLRSAYRTALERPSVLGYGGTLEAPLKEGITAVARARYLRVDQRDWDEEERGEDAYVDAFSAAYQVYAFQAALRIYPWEWLPGFFSEALMGYKRIISGTPAASPGWSEWVTEPGVPSFENHAYEAALGYGYRWSWGPLRASLGFAFGPELVFRTSRLAGGDVRTVRDFSDLLRFNALEIGCGF